MPVVLSKAVMRNNRRYKGLILPMCPAHSWCRLSPFLCLFTALLALSCGHTPKTVVAMAPPDRFSEPTPRDRYADDVGRFLAGLPAKPGSQLADLENDKAWMKHRDELDLAWRRMEAEPLPAMRQFQNGELNADRTGSAPVFYPFSGPDALMVTVFFPKSPTYFMVGLEPAGTLPAPKQFAHKNLARYLANVRATVASELGRSFFITRQMDRQFRGQVTDGLFLPILQLLVRTEHTVLGYRYVRLDDAGWVVERAPGYHAPGKIGNKGVEIDFRTDSDQSLHKLFYFSVNLSNSSLRDNSPFQSFVSTIRGPITFLKATSSMIHKPEFSIVREEVLSKSIAVLQDDSGIPYRFYAAPPWRVQLYGEYVRPYGSFRWLEQPDLKKAYLSSGPRPLTFRIGYG
jgi:hypothetical protein